MDITIFDTSTGAILCNTSVTNTDNLILSEGQSYVEGYYSDDEYFIYEGLAAPKLNFNVTIYTNSISGLPIGTKAVIPELGDKYIIDDGFIELNPLAGYSGSILVILSKPCYNTLSINVPLGVI